MARADERQGDAEFLVAGAQDPAQRRVLLLGDQFEVIAGDFERQRAAGHVLAELAQLQFDALAHGARADAGRVTGLDVAEHGLDLGRSGRELGAERFVQFGDRVREVAVVVDAIDDDPGNGKLPLAEPAELELPQQVLVQGLAAPVRQLHRAVVIAVPGSRLGGRGTVALPVVGRGFGGLAVRVGVGRCECRLAERLFSNVRRAGAHLVRFRLQGDALQRLDLVAVVLGFEHHVLFERLPNLLLQLQRRQLQQADCLLQLRSHGELLA